MLETKTAATALNWVQTSAYHSETVVLIHAVGHDLTYWDRQIEALQSDYNVVAFDLSGHGRSPGDPNDWSFDNAAATVATLIERVSTKPVHIIVISFGEMIAQVTTLARPELIRSLTLIGTAARFPEEVQKGMRLRISWPYNERSSLTALHFATLEAAPPSGGVMVSTGLLVAERHAGVWTPVIAHKTISAEPQFALAA